MYSPENHEVHCSLNIGNVQCIAWHHGSNILPVNNSIEISEIVTDYPSVVIGVDGFMSTSIWAGPKPISAPNLGFLSSLPACSLVPFCDFISYLAIRNLERSELIRAGLLFLGTSIPIALYFPKILERYRRSKHRPLTRRELLKLAGTLIIGTITIGGIPSIGTAIFNEVINHIVSEAINTCRSGSFLLKLKSIFDNDPNRADAALRTAVAAWKLHHIPECELEERDCFNSRRLLVLGGGHLLPETFEVSTWMFYKIDILREAIKIKLAQEYIFLKREGYPDQEIEIILRLLLYDITSVVFTIVKQTPQGSVLIPAKNKQGNDTLDFSRDLYA